VVVVFVVLGVAGVPVAVVVDVVDDEPFAAGPVPLDPVTLGLVVVVVVLQAPRRRASGPHVEVVVSIGSNDAFRAAMVDGPGCAGDVTTTAVAVTVRRSARSKPTGARPTRRALSLRARTRARSRKRARAVSRCGRRGTRLFSLRVARGLYPLPANRNPVRRRKTC
jgi:hypothetical protein